MSSIISIAGHLKPEIRLDRAVSEFEASLPDGQKVAFRNQRTQSLQCPPDTKDVMRITAEIDASQQAGGRCFGPRFTKFLHGVQQFAALGDVVVGSSQNVVACGVWTVVRTCLLATTNRASYLESLSLLLMEAGRSTQQHADLALLYPRSKPLQTYITEYFIVVVQICLRYHLYAQKSALGKFTSSLNDADVKESRSSLLAWSTSIQAETTTLIAKRIETEAESDSRFRDMMNLSSKTAAQQRNQIVLRDILDCCSTHDYETTWRQIRKAGNTSLYAQMPEYQQWIAGSDCKTLVLVGKLGYGKSVTLANMVDDLNLRIGPGVFVLAYFFCRHDLPESLVPRTVIGALVRQIIKPFPKRLVETEAVGINGFPQLINLMHRVIPHRHAIYIVLDGLDLCSSPERKIIIEQLELMRTQFNIRTCVSRRLEPEAELQYLATEFSKAKVAWLPDNTPDIEAFITAQLEIVLSNQSLALGNPTIILEIQDALLRGSQHMFLWVTLQIQSLCTMHTDHDIREALGDLPQDLSQIYSQILQHSKRPGRLSQSYIFKLVSSARRPLSTEEMREALSVIPGDSTWDPSKVLNSIYPALATCGCLIIVDEEELTVRTVHSSVDQFLLHESFNFPNMAQGVHFTLEDAQILISSIVITYLSYGIFGNELAVRVAALNVGTAPSHIIESTTRTHKSVQSLALRLLGSKKKPEFDVSKALAQAFKQHLSFSVDDFHFQHYAKAYILEHLAELPDPVTWCPISDSLLRLFKQGTVCTESSDCFVGLLWLLLQPTGDPDIIACFPRIVPEAASAVITASFCKLFDRAIELGRVNAIQYLLDIYRPLFLDYVAATQEVGSHVHPALKTLCNSIWLCDRVPSRNELSRSFLGPTPLSYAIAMSQDFVAQVLIGDDLIDLNETADNLGSGLLGKPIRVAMKLKNITLLRLLLKQDRKRLVLSELEIKLLLNDCRTLQDISVKSALEQYQSRMQAGKAR